MCRKVHFTQQQGASVREKGSLGRMPVPVRTVSHAVQEHEEVTCLGQITVKEANSLVGVVQL